MSLEQTRDAFEKWISSAPIHAEVSRWPADGKCLPGQYQDYRTQLAWEAWCEAIKQKNENKAQT